MLPPQVGARERAWKLLLTHIASTQGRGGRARSRPSVFRPRVTSLGTWSSLDFFIDLPDEPLHVIG